MRPHLTSPTPHHPNRELAEKDATAARSSVLYALMDSVARMRRRLDDEGNALAGPIAALERAHVRLCAVQRDGSTGSGGNEGEPALGALRPGLLQVCATPYADARGCAVHRAWYGGAAVDVRRLRLGAAGPSEVARFEKDAQTLQRMHHPYIVQFYGFALDADAQPFVVTAAHQCTLADAIHRPAEIARPPLSLEDKFQIAQQIVCYVLLLFCSSSSS